MKQIALVVVCLWSGLGVGVAQLEADKSLSPAMERRLKTFFAHKESLARSLAKKEDKEQSPDVWSFFDAAKRGEWATVDSTYRRMRRAVYQYMGGRKDERLERMVWQAVNESYGGLQEVWNGEEHYVRIFADEILASIKPGSIYFGGTDPGRWLITTFCKSHAGADPCFVLTQNALADGLYLQYLRTLFGERIRIPTDADSKQAFETYIADAKQRADKGRLKPGEHIFEDDDGKTQASGHVAVMAINAALAKKIFDDNPKLDFYVEESFPLDWMYPHLVPNGLIMKVERRPPAQLSDEVVRQDSARWTRFVRAAVGDWLKPETTVKELCAFAKTVFEENDLSAFRGDRRFLNNKPAQRTFSKLRSAIGGVYAWRAEHSASPEDKRRMDREAEVAFRQSFALCPYSPEAVFRYTNLLVRQGRKPEALLLAQTAQSVDPANSSISQRTFQLEENE